MSEATDRIDRNARAALAVLGADTQRLFQRADESVEAFVSRMAYSIAYKMEAERKFWIESGWVVEPVEEPPHDDNLPRLPSALSEEQVDSACDWARVGFSGSSDIEKNILRNECLHWHKALLVALSGAEPTEPAEPASQGMVFPVRVFENAGDVSPISWDTRSLDDLESVLLKLRLPQLSYIVRDNNNVDWTPDGFGGYKRKDA